MADPKIARQIIIFDPEDGSFRMIDEMLAFNMIVWNSCGSPELQRKSKNENLLWA